MTYGFSKLLPIQQNWLFLNSNIPHRFMGLGSEDITEDMGSFPEEINDWIESVYAGDVIKSVGKLGKTGVGLLFAGAPGLGKTTHAVVSAMELIRRLPADEQKMRAIFQVAPGDSLQMLRSVYYLTYPEFLSRKKGAWDGEPEAKARAQMEIDGFHGRAKADEYNVRVLILDDLGKEYGSSFDDASFDEVLRSRYDKGLPTIITTNKDRDDWAGQYGAAMGSFAFEAFHSVTIIGKDLRKG
jgi:DNA replication protein DnaC